MKNLKRFALAIAISAALTAPIATAQQRGTAERNLTRMEREVRHELVMLPYYNVFDNLAYKVDPSGVVTLYGAVTRPTLKDSAERVVKDVEGVSRVVNNIEVLPVSPSDDRIRIATYRRIYGYDSLQRYGLAAVPSIHIIVKNGDVTLEGVVDNEADKNMVGMQARSVPGVFSVKNNLQVEQSK
jgi:hyperosmotically inducible protein